MKKMRKKNDKKKNERKSDEFAPFGRKKCYLGPNHVEKEASVIIIVPFAAFVCHFHVHPQ